MTLTLHLTPEQVAHLQAEADRTGLALTDYVRRRLLGDAFQTAIDADDATRLAAVDAALGALAGSGISTEDFMREKQAEVAREEARWEECFGPRSTCQRSSMPARSSPFLAWSKAHWLCGRRSETT